MIEFLAEENALAAYEGLKDIGLNLGAPTADCYQDVREKIRNSVLRSFLGGSEMHVPTMGFMEGLRDHAVRLDHESKDEKVI